MNLKIIVLASAVLLSGCNEDPRVPALEQRLLAKLNELEAANRALAEEVDRLKLQVELATWDQIAFLKPGDEGYSALKYDLGVVTVKLADVKPYANGSKVALQFGNLTSARIDGLKAKLEWGKVNDKGIAQNDVAKSRDVTFNESLPAGAWTVTELVLEGIPPTELGFVRLKNVGHRGIGLRR